MNLKEYLEKNKDLDDRSFGRFVRQRREEVGLTVRGMAGELEMSPAYLSDIEKGNRYAPTKHMDRLRELLRVSDDETQLFLDLASFNRDNQYEDINPYLGKQPLARVALRKARDIGLSDEQWKAFIDTMDKVDTE